MRHASNWRLFSPGSRKCSANGIVAARCAPCHGSAPTLTASAPQGVLLESPAQLQALAARIREQVAARAMPPGNLTQMTEPEREDLLLWAAGR